MSTSPSANTAPRPKYTRKSSDPGCANLYKTELLYYFLEKYSESWFFVPNGKSRHLSMWLHFPLKEHHKLNAERLHSQVVPGTTKPLQMYIVQRRICPKNLPPDVNVVGEYQFRIVKWDGQQESLAAAETSAFSDVPDDMPPTALNAPATRLPGIGPNPGPHVTLTPFVLTPTEEKKPHLSRKTAEKTPSAATHNNMPLASSTTLDCIEQVLKFAAEAKQRLHDEFVPSQQTVLYRKGYDDGFAANPLPNTLVNLFRDLRDLRREAMDLLSGDTDTYLPGVDADRADRWYDKFEQVLNSTATTPKQPR